MNNIIVNLDEIPYHIVEKAVEISKYMRENNYTTWELGDICSRNHADAVRVYKNALDFVCKEAGKYK